MTDFSLYIITDRQINGKRSIFKSVTQSLSAGANILQMREKKASTAEMMSLGQKLQKIAAKFRVPFIINDRIDVAIALQTDGVHVGQDDMPAKVARRLIGRKKILGGGWSTVRFRSGIPQRIKDACKKGRYLCGYRYGGTKISRHCKKVFWNYDSCSRQQVCSP